MITSAVEVVEAVLCDRGVWSASLLYDVQDWVMVGVTEGIRKRINSNSYET
jgi:hypothetical protein